MTNILEYSERVYSVFLSLYPADFRARFGPEMSQLFRDCCRDALEKGEVAVVVAFCVQTTKDIVCSVLRERSREVLRPVNMEHPVMTVVDLLLIPSIVTANLMVLGPILTLLLVGVPAIDAPLDQFMATSAFFSFVIGSFAVTTSLVFSRLRPTVRLWVKL